MDEQDNPVAIGLERINQTLGNIEDLIEDLRERLADIAYSLAGLAGHLNPDGSRADRIPPK